MPSYEIPVPVADNPMSVYVATPGGGGPTPAIVVIQHAPGVDLFIRAMADRLAQAGYLAAAPDLYHRQEAGGDAMAKMRNLRDREVQADVEATVAMLRARADVDGDRLGITGFCMGGRVVWLMAAAVPVFRAAVVYYGGNIQVPWGEDVPAPFARAGQIACPLLFHFGADDGNPSPDDMARYDRELTRLGKPHEFHGYAGAAHAFMNFTREASFRQGASRLSWERTLGFLARHLSAHRPAAQDPAP